jgi:hypothetical protein
VEKPVVNQLMFVRVNPHSKQSYVGFTDWQKNPNSIASKNFFGKDGIPPAVFVYGGRDSINDNRVYDYIRIDMIHPDYVLGPEEGYANVISPEVFEMAKKRDFSFIMPVLFRRVGKDTNDMLFLEDTRPWKKAKDLFIMYKPINHWGNDDFNEIRNVNQSDNGEWVGESSILKDKPRIQEMTDVELLNLIDAQNSNIQLFTAKAPTNFKNELTEGFDNQLNNLSLQQVKTHSMYYKMSASENLTGRDTSTLELAELGLRTATTRSYPLGKVGDIITFENRPQKYIITQLEQLTENNVKDENWIAEWSRKEQWTINHFQKVLGGKTVHVGSWQTSFERISEDDPRIHKQLSPNSGKTTEDNEERGDIVDKWKEESKDCRNSNL